MTELKQKTGLDLVQSRREGLRELNEASAMKAHGKVAGMDSFSWSNPDVDSLANFIATMPFEVIWVARCEQLREFGELHDALLEKVHTVVLYDQVERNSSMTWMRNVRNVAFVEGAGNALQFMHALKKSGAVFLFTSCGQSDRDDFQKFEIFLKGFGG